MHANFLSGNSFARLRTSSVNRKPTPKTSFESPEASWRSCASRSEPSLVSNVVKRMPSSFCASWRPLYAASLKLLSPRPPMSNTRPTGNSPVTGFDDSCAGWLHPAAASSATRAATSDLRVAIMGSVGCGHRTRPAAQVEAAPAARLVDLGAAHHDAAAALHFSIGPIGGRAADDADRQRLGDVLGDRQQLRHGLERPPAVILVEPGDDDALAHARELLAHGHELGAEELPLVDADHLRLVRVLQDLRCLLHRARRDAHLVVGHDRVLGIAIVDRGLEDLHALAGDLRAAQPADQLLRLAAVHAADDDFDRAGVRERAGGFAHGASLRRDRRRRVHAALAEQLADLRLHQVDRDLVVAAAGDDDVGETLAGLHELEVHRAHAVLVLAKDGVHRAPALEDVAPQPADEPDVRVGIHEQLDVHQRPQLGVVVDEDALEHDHQVIADVPRLRGALVLPVVVDRLVDGVALEQLAQVLAQQVVVEGVRVVEVPRLAVAERDLFQVLVITVLVDHDHALGAQLAHDGTRHERLAGPGSAGDADEDAPRHAEKKVT